MGLQQTIELENAVQSRGFSSVNEFALQKIREDILADMKVSLDIIDRLERKYGMNYDDFARNISNIHSHSLLDKEEDSMEWRGEIEALRVSERRLSKLL